MKAKRFFYVCAGLFLLALGYGVGSQQAEAASNSQTVVGFTIGPYAQALYVITSNGDVWEKPTGLPSAPGFVGNFWTSYDAEGNPVR
jgi:hypothetical protein